MQAYEWAVKLKLLWSNLHLFKIGFQKNNDLMIVETGVCCLPIVDDYAVSEIPYCIWDYGKYFFIMEVFDKGFWLTQLYVMDTIEFWSAVRQVLVSFFNYWHKGLFLKLFLL